MENQIKSDVHYSLERIFELCFMQKNVLSIELCKPMTFKDEKVKHLCVKEIDEPKEIIEQLLKRVLLRNGNTDGQLKVKAFIDNPLDCERITIDSNNVLSIDHKM